MANTLLTIDMITQEALRVLHEKLTFIRSIHRGYDDQFAKAGAKIGSKLRVRAPVQYKVGQGATMVPQDTVEEYVDLRVDRQSHVGIQFGGAEMALSLDDYSDRILQPAMSVMAADMEAYAIMRATQTAQWQVGTPGTTPSAMLTYLAARTKLNQALAPKDRDRNMLISSNFSEKIIDSLKALAQDEDEVSRQYREGSMGRMGGFDWAESESMYTHVNGTATVAAQMNATVTVDGTDQLSLKGLGTTNTVTAGTVLEITGRFDVHPETKAVRTTTKQFVVQETVAAVGGIATVTVSPKVYFAATGRQNIATAPANNDVVTLLGAAAPAANSAYECGLAYHKNAYTVATADLPLPSGGEGSRKQFEGISMRIWRDSQILTDTHLCRVDVLWGITALRGQHAVRVAG